MILQRNRWAELFAGRWNKVIWIALAWFSLGSALCPFNPPVEHIQQSMKAGNFMNNISESQLKKENGNNNVTSSSEIETATFALG